MLSLGEKRDGLWVVFLHSSLRERIGRKGIFFFYFCVLNFLYV